MVALKVRSPEDIISAYLQSWGFDKNTSAFADKILKDYNQELNNSSDIFCTLESMIQKTADKVFAEENIETSQKLALLKYCFLNAKGASKWELMLFNADSLSADFIKNMQKYKIVTAPEYTISHMEAQVIEPIDPNLLHKFISKSKKA